jgi:hypothetical protein
MSQEARGLLDELRGAINQVLNNSKSFGEILDLLKRSGHDVLISVDATVDIIGGSDCSDAQTKKKSVPAQRRLRKHDLRFLRAIRIGDHRLPSQVAHSSPLFSVRMFPRRRVTSMEEHLEHLLYESGSAFNEFPTGGYRVIHALGTLERTKRRVTMLFYTSDVLTAKEL